MQRTCLPRFVSGSGGFQLSLFGYDFVADHLALTNAEAGRVNTEKPEESMILVKPTDADQHEGGKRMDVDSWQYRVLRHWIAAGAKPTGKLHSLKRLEVQPQEIIVQRSGERIPLRAIAHWNDGTIEDVTELCRFSTNDDVIAQISEDGVCRVTRKWRYPCSRCLRQSRGAGCCDAAYLSGPRSDQATTPLVASH